MKTFDTSCYYSSSWLPVRFTCRKWCVGSWSQNESLPVWTSKPGSKIETMIWLSRTAAVIKSLVYIYFFFSCWFFLSIKMTKNSFFFYSNVTSGPPRLHLIVAAGAPRPPSLLLPRCHCSLDDKAHVPPYSASWWGVGGLFVWLPLSQTHASIWRTHVLTKEKKGRGRDHRWSLFSVAVKRRDALAICGACL